MRLPPTDPPVLARALLRRALPEDVADGILGDLEELFRERRERRGVRRARRWYRREALRLSTRFVVERAVERLRGGGPGFSWLDVKLGLRMLVKYPGLTLAGGLGMTVAIALGAGFVDFARDLFAPSLPLDGGDRIVGIQTWDVAADRAERRSLHDFGRWLDGLESIEDLGAFRTLQRNLVHADGQTEPIAVAEITASAFRVARVPPLLGRPLLVGDEQEGAVPVAVIGYGLWQLRFGGEPDVVGAVVQLGADRRTVVGVMPRGFRFPINHSAWVPLPAGGNHPPRGGPAVFVFGRLHSGTSLARTQAELDGLGRRMAAESPETHARLRPRVVPYTEQFIDTGNGRIARLIQIFFAALVMVPCANVAILVYARTMTRQGETSVRAALGASRARIVTQHFVEVLVLVGLSAFLALGAARWALGPVEETVRQGSASGLPFWWTPGLAPSTLLYVTGLTLLAGVVTGVVPALRATGRRMQTALRQVGASGSTIRLGRTWTGVVVAQVAISVAFLPPLLDEAWEGVRQLGFEPGFPAERYLAAQLVMDGGPLPDAEPEVVAEFESRLGARYAEMTRRLEAETGVSGVTFASRLPGEEQAKAVIAVDGGPPTDVAGATHEVRSVSVATGFFRVLDAPVLAGRPFAPGDLGTDAVPVVVNASFVEDVLGGANAVGRRIRYPASEGDEDGPWHEIVGVVSDLAPNPTNPGEVEARVFRPVEPGSLRRIHLAIRLGPRPEAFAPRLRELTAALDPTLRLYNVLPLDDVARTERRGLRVFHVAIALATLSLLLLTTMGVYALMSFVVAQRRREIGIRAALGADPRRLLMELFLRAFRQVGLGALAGGALTLSLHLAAPEGLFVPEHGPGLLVVVGGLMVGVGILAATGPARRGLRIQPTEALRGG